MKHINIQGGIYMKKRLIAAVLSTTIMSALMSGCGVSTDTNTGSASTGESTQTNKTESTQVSTPEKASAGEEEITWMFWDDLNATEDLVTKGYKAVVDRFNEKYEGQYHCNVVTTNLDEYTTKLNATIAAGTVPDVFICDPGPRMKQYVDSGITADLTDILQNEEKDWYSTFSDGIFEKITYDGKIMAIPTNFAAACVFYNTEIFEEAGVTPPETYDELLEACEKIKAIGKAPISCSANTSWCLGMIAGYLCDREGGAEILEAVNNGTEGAWNDPAFIRAGEKLKELSQYFQETAASDSNDQAVANFYNGEAAMLVQGSWAIAQINGNVSDFEQKCGIFRFPAIDGGADPNRMVVKTDNLCMSAKTEHKDACIALMKMFTDDEAQKYVAEVAGKIPSTKVQFDQNKAPKQLAYIQDILSKTTGTLGFYNESLATNEAGDTFNNAMVEIYLGTATPEQAFQKIEDFYAENMR